MQRGLQIFFHAKIFPIYYSHPLYAIFNNFGRLENKNSMIFLIIIVNIKYVIYSVSSNLLCSIFVSLSHAPNMFSHLSMIFIVWRLNGIQVEYSDKSPNDLVTIVNSLHFFGIIINFVKSIHIVFNRDTLILHLI